MGDKEKESAAYDEQSVINAIRQAYKLVEGINSQVVEKAVVFCNREVSFLDTARVYALSESNNSRNRAVGLRESDILLSPESFGVCMLDARKCIPEIEDQKWQECDQSQKINGEACVTMDSYMVCLKGGIITLKEDGQRIDELMKLYFPEYVTIEQLRALKWHDVDEKMTFELNRVLERYGITTVERIRHFLAQCIKESNRGMYTREGEYSDWKSQKEYEEEYDRKYEYGYKYRGAGYIQMTWDYSYLAFATFLIQQECKDDNVNIEWKSPRNNADGFQDRYDEAVKNAENIGKDIEKYKNIVEEGADYVAEEFAWEAAGYDWYQKGLNSVVDGLKPDDKMEVDQVTKIINYYDTETYEERRNYYEEVLTIIK